LLFVKKVLEAHEKRSQIKHPSLFFIITTPGGLNLSYLKLLSLLQEKAALYFENRTQKVCKYSGKVIELRDLKAQRKSII